MFRRSRSEKLEKSEVGGEDTGTSRESELDSEMGGEMNEMGKAGECEGGKRDNEKVWVSLNFAQST